MRQTSFWFLLGWIIAAVLLLDACRKGTAVEATNQTSSVVPLALGNSWKYAAVVYDTSGATELSGYEEENIQKDTTLLGRKYFLFQPGWCSDTDSGMIYCYYGHPVDNSTVPALYYKFPASRGDTYSSNAILVRIVSTDTLISVPAGTFPCLAYQFYQSGLLTNTHFVSPALGVVKYVDYFAYQYPRDPMRLFGVAELLQYTLR